MSCLRCTKASDDAPHGGKEPKIVVSPEHLNQDDSDDSDDDYVDSFDENLKKKNMGNARQSVSAECFGEWNVKDTNFKPPVVPKSQDQREICKSVLLRAFMFGNLSDGDLAIVLDAMEDISPENGENVIAQGDAGDFLFVIEEGTFECWKKIDDEEKMVKSCGSGDVFGELALLYNVPRAATVKCVSDGARLWKLDRATFQNIVLDAAVKRRERYGTFLKSISLLENMEPYEISQISDALKSDKFSSGDEIIRQGDPGDKFYILETGIAVAVKDGAEVLKYGPGEYFGELALLSNEPRKATVSATSDCECLWLDSSSFHRLIGPLEPILARNKDRYS